MKQIRSVTDTNVFSTVYGFEKTTLDYETGEVKQRDNMFITQAKKKDDFLKLFVLNLEFIATELENSEKTVLLLIISNMNFKNIININPDLKAEIVHKSKMHRNTVAKAILSLEEKNIIYKLDNDELREKYDVFSKYAYLVNPDVIGKGTFRDLKNLRQTVVTDFDFETLEMKKQIIRETKYDDFGEISQNKNDYEVKAVTHQVDHSKKQQDTSILIGKKDPSLLLEDDKELGAFWLAGGTVTGAFEDKTVKELKAEIIDAEYEEKK